MKTIYYYDSPIGALKLVCKKDALQELHFCEKLGKNPQIYPKIISTCKEQLDKYFAGKLKKFTIPLDFKSGTEFQKKVWNALLKIPYGKTISYKQLAGMIENPKAIRAVGGANNKNPIPIIVPCHRVIGSNGKLVGYASGLKIKKYLLDLECK
ncbi:methylated-DNA--[protein]-cysteine S-methyltransferase [Sulfurospirillum sp. 1307]